MCFEKVVDKAITSCDSGSLAAIWFESPLGSRECHYQRWAQLLRSLTVNSLSYFVKNIY
jgi:hypothetical protein